MPTTFKKGLDFIILVMVVGLVGCATTNSDVTVTSTVMAAPSVALGFYYLKGAFGAGHVIQRLGASGFSAGMSASMSCSTTPSGQIQCDDDGPSVPYRDYSGFTASGFSFIVPEIDGTQELVVHSPGGMTCAPAVPGTAGCALYRHNPGREVLETHDFQALPTVPACTAAQTTISTIRPSDLLVLPAGPVEPTAFYITGSLGVGDLIDTYTFTASVGDRIFISLDSETNDFDLDLSGPPGTISAFEGRAIATVIPANGVYMIDIYYFRGTSRYEYRLTVCKA